MVSKKTKEKAQKNTEQSVSETKNEQLADFGEIQLGALKEVDTKKPSEELKNLPKVAGKKDGEKEEKKGTEKKAAEEKKVDEQQKRKRGKKYLEKAEKIEKNKKYTLAEAIELGKEVSYTKFPGTLELHINTNQKNIRGLLTLPFMAGKKLVILAFGKDAEKSGADMVGTDEKLEQIQKSKIDFDCLVTTPEWMPKLARVAKILGPRGLMPSPKNGTITDNLEKVVTELQAGKVEYKSEKDVQVIHMTIGKVTQPSEEISANIKTLFTVIGKSRIKGMIIAPTMGPGVRIDLGSI